MTKKRVGRPAPGQRRVFTAEFKLESVRRFDARRAQGVSQAQIARELDLSVAMLRSWARELDRQPAVPVDEVFPGHGRLPSDAEELRRLQREVHRLQQENSFLKNAAAYFAKESR
jgi:transposase